MEVKTWRGDDGALDVKVDVAATHECDELLASDGGVIFLRVVKKLIKLVHKRRCLER